MNPTGGPPSPAPYENGVISQATGGPIRPGGLELTRRMITLCGLPRGANILDAGCGSGGSVQALGAEYGLQAFGLDRSQKLLHSGAAAPAQLALTCAISQSMPFAAGVMDAVMAECSLSAMSDAGASLREFRRVLKPGGLIALSDLYARNPQGVHSLRALPLGCGLRLTLTRQEIEHLLQQHHFEIVAWEDHSHTIKYLAAQMIFTHGSINEFWSKSEPAADPFDIQIAVSRARLGYYLLVARLAQEAPQQQNTMRNYS